MKGIKGELSSLPLTDLMQWIEMNKKSGVLFLKKDKSGRCFCFKEGNLLLASSNEDGQRFGDYLKNEAHLPLDRIRDAVQKSREQGTPFIDDLASSKLVPEEFMKVLVEQVAESVLIDVLSWGEGAFHFIEALPKFVEGGLIKLNTTHLVFESVRKFDEARRQGGGA